MGVWPWGDECSSLRELLLGEVEDIGGNGEKRLVQYNEHGVGLCEGSGFGDAGAVEEVALGVEFISDGAADACNDEGYLGEMGTGSMSEVDGYFFVGGGG